jgi:inhibitor of cysteine peptidase
MKFRKSKVYAFSIMLPVLIFAAAFALHSSLVPEVSEMPANVDSNGLPTVGTYENLKKLMKQAEKSRQTMFKGMDMGFAVAENAEVAKSAATADSAAAPAAGPDYSTTNVQVQGVDEADTVKTDGTYIYQIQQHQHRLVISQANPAKEMKIVKVLQYEQNQFMPRELYVDDKYLIVIGTTYRNYKMEQYNKNDATADKRLILPYPEMHTVKAFIYDVKDRANLKQLREVELEGNYVSSRKIGSSLYFVANKYIDHYRIMNEKQEQPAPAFRDTVQSGQFENLDYEDIRYFPEFTEPNYLLIAGINLDNSDEAMKVSAYIGAGHNIYASTENLYAAITQYEKEDRNTVIYKFQLDQGQVEYSAQGKVPGNILNQFSMDEHKGYFRIATTKGEMWRNDEQTSKNNVYILDEQMKTVGSIEDIAPGERIYSARFMGDRGYMVTFRTVDPLFVIDLKDPKAPKILGELKIPGYSDYLHPYDENHLIGFGKDTIEISMKDGRGGADQKMAYYQGMKIALFDVTDVHNPKEKFVEIIGDRGTHSELLHNHKALLFSKARNLMAFPVTVMEIKNKSNNNSQHVEHGQFTFQGAYVYHIDAETGFTLQKKITHLSDEDMKKAGDYWYDSNKNVERILFINNTLYTLSQQMIKAHDLTTFEEENRLLIP